jgi:ABC-type glycerol-3-phosphate transport system substrate-binding protein
MRLRLSGSLATAALLVAACQPAGDGASPGATATPADGMAEECLGEGSVILSGWQASPEEGELLQQMFDAFEAACPNITVDYQPIAGD